MVVAGGQGTRLGYDGPKGCLPVTPVRNKPLFQLFAEQLRAAGRRCGSPQRDARGDRPLRWYIMTSPTNDAATRDFFRSRRFFGLDEQQVIFFQQGVLPAFGRDGRILLEQKHRVALAPDGHGGSLLAMATRGVLADMAARGIDYLSYFQVDNPLVRCIDPLFIGLHDLHGSEMSSKCLPKADDHERVGNFVLAGGRLHVIEYSDLPDDLAEARNTDGSRRFDAASPAIHVLSRRFVERLTADPAHFALPWHRAEKKVACVDLASGRRIEPDEPNGVKLEAFIFDALPLAERTLLLETRREEEFSPLKNATGADSLETSRRDQVRRAARWLEQAGVRVPRGADGEPAVPIEISPLRAVEAGDLLTGPMPSPEAFRGPVYLE
jgi:UDP-N-acetylglucosamine/UDP-N-acetylgalactosamine diphosphorylase